MQISEFWHSESVLKPHLEPVRGGYVDDIRRMVTMWMDGRAMDAHVSFHWISLSAARERDLPEVSFSQLMVEPEHANLSRTRACDTS
jgi:hypothetical protein